MKIITNYPFEKKRKYSAPDFTAKIQSGYLLDAIIHSSIVNNENYNSIRLSQLADVTDIPVAKMKKKLKNPESLKIFNDVFGEIIKNEYPDIANAAFQYEKDLTEIFHENNPKLLSDINKVLNKFYKKLGDEVDINLDDGIKRFFNKYIDMF